MAVSTMSKSNTELSYIELNNIELCSSELSTDASTPSPTATPVTDDNDWMTAYLVEDDYRLASEASGRDIHPDAEGHLGAVSSELEIIASARMIGSLACENDAGSSLFQYFANADFSTALKYICQHG